MGVLERKGVKCDSQSGSKVGALSLEEPVLTDSSEIYFTGLERVNYISKSLYLTLC